MTTTNNKRATVELTTAQVITAVTGMMVCSVEDAFSGMDRILGESPHGMMTHHYAAAAEWLRPRLVKDPETSWAIAVDRARPVVKYVANTDDVEERMMNAAQYCLEVSEIVGDTHQVPYLGDEWAEVKERVLVGYIERFLGDGLVG